ncbi:MAG: hypothetical protein COV99_01225 [Bacteroidetes bacterium CG12_big_fil_rev_8_21_14_0_65_60_17]|nr:MAG: hypothetical protein COV99_01225 [Bacteroidetes bacterium CG12_big_fil_rev_8_21_14_0_65_60_17]
MRHSRPQKLGDILRQVSAEIGLDSHLEKGRVIATWEDLMSPPMRTQVVSTRLEKDRLFVQVSSAAWRHELHAQRKEWCERLNNELGRRAVREIVFR